MKKLMPTNGTDQSKTAESSAQSFGSGEMAALIDSCDWSKTALGPKSHWSPELLSIVAAMLNAPIPMFVMWGSDLIMLYNDAARPITSTKHPGALGQCCKVAWKEAWHIIGSQLEEVFQCGSSIRHEATLVPLEMEGGLEDVYFDYSYSPLFERGHVAGVLVISQNVTDAVLSARALREAEAKALTMTERLQMALSATDGIGVWDWDIAGNRVYTDARFAVLYGVDPECAASGVPIADFLKNLHADDLERTQAAIANAMKTGEEFEAEYRLVQADKSVRWVSAKGRCVFDVDGSPARFPGVTVDVTKRKTVEQALRSSEERLTIAAETASLGTWELDLETGQMQCSPLCKANYGRSADSEFNYADLRACIHADDALSMKTAVEEAIAHHSVYRFEYRIFWPDGTLHWVIASGRASYDKANKPLRMAGVSMDVTDRHAAQEVMIQTEKLAAVGRLAASIAHEINNPLESVTNLLYLARGSKTFLEVQQYLDTAERELRRVSAISNQTLRFYKQSTNPTAVTCEELFDSVLGIYQGRIVNTRVEVEKRKRARKAVLCFDGEIRQVLNNLVGNAIDAMHPAGGRLLLRSTDGTDWKSGRQGLILTVGDTGSGMPMQVVAKMFEAFYTTKGIGGTGLGLWVSQEIIRRHRGTIRVKSSSRKNHSGTVMRLFLPFEAAAR